VPTTITINSVVTEDAVPAVAPHRISADPAHDDVTFAFTPVHDGNIVPRSDLVPGEGTIYPDEGWCPDDPLMVADRGAIIPGVPRDTVGYIIREGGATPSSGRLIRQVTNRCSDNRVCGSTADFAVRDPARELRVQPPNQIVDAFTFADANDGGADGPRDINVWVLTENQGWT
jgi:hypothetical protein